MKNKGFTLIELMMVLTIMAVVSTVLLKSMSGLQDQTRYNQTVERVNQIKQAIVNVQTINGAPTVSGFIADVSRLPSCIRELIDGHCDASPPTPCDVSTPTTCSLVPSTWKGPYLQTSNGTFYDGWGNTDTTYSADNFGWYFYLSTTQYYTALAESKCSTLIDGVSTPTLCDTLTLQSLGADGLPDSYTALPMPYDADYPPNNSTPPSYPTSAGIPTLINPIDWIIDLSTTGLNVQFNHLPSMAISTSSGVSTTCSTGVPTTNLTGNAITSTCTIPTPTPPATATAAAITVTNTITCPTGYYLTPPSSWPTTLPPLPSSTVNNIYCESATGNISVANTSCSQTNLSPPPSLGPLPASTDPQKVTITCSYTPTLTASTTTILSQACASGVPVSLLILENDLFGNSIVPIPASSGALPSNSCQSFITINYEDYATLTKTPVPIGNWNICAFQSPINSSDFPASIPLTNPPTTCVTTVNSSGSLFLNPLLYHSTITVLPRSQPSVAW